MATSLGWRDHGQVLLSKRDAERERIERMRGDKDEPVFQGATLSRRQHKERRVDKELERNREEAADFMTELEEVLDQRPEGRLKWLHKALVLAGKKSLKVEVIYKIIMEKKFLSGAKDKVGAQMKAILLGNLHLFGPKQQRALQSESCPFSAFDVKNAAKRSAKRDPSPRKKKKKKRKKRGKSSSSSSSSSGGSGKRRGGRSSSSSSRGRKRPAGRSAEQPADAAAAAAPALTAPGAVAAAPAPGPTAKGLDPRIFAAGAADDF